MYVLLFAGDDVQGKQGLPGQPGQPGFKVRYFAL